MIVVRDETLSIKSSDDVVRVRQQARTRAVEIGLGLVDQTKIVTAASELARNTVDYGGGTVRMQIRRPWSCCAPTGSGRAGRSNAIRGSFGPIQASSPGCCTAISRGVATM
jgi:hypothetical protein